MPRKVDISACISPCTASFLWQSMYAEPKPTQEYHALVNKDPAADVQPWKDGMRNVTFCMPLAAPDWVKRTVGIDNVRVRETQVVVWHNSRSFTVKSDTTMLNVPGATRFTTSLVMSVTEKYEPGAETFQSSNGGGKTGDAGNPDGTGAYCEVVFTVKCSAGMPWPLATSVENIMADGAQASMTGYLEYCQTVVDAAVVAMGGKETGVKDTEAGGTDLSADLLTDLSMTQQPKHVMSQAGAPSITSLQGRRSIRWPSVAVSTFAEDLELAPPAGLPSDAAQHSMLPARPSAVFMSPGPDTDVLLPPRDRRPSSSHFYDATEAWMSPVTSFSPSGYASDAEGLQSGGPPTMLGRPAGISTPDLTPAALALALQTLTNAVQSLDKRVAALANQLNQSSGTRPTTAHSPSRLLGVASPFSYHTIPDDEDIEAGDAGNSCRGRKRAGVTVAWSLLLTAIVLVFAYSLWVQFGPHPTGLRPQPPSPTSLI